MTADEVHFWDAVFLRYTDFGYGVFIAAECADCAVLARRERWGQTKGVYR